MNILGRLSRNDDGLQWEPMNANHKELVVSLLPCPFCGSDRFKIVEVDSHTSGYCYVECRDCGSKGASAHMADHSKAVANWQRRPSPTDQGEKK